MRLLIKNMVCPRCITAVRTLLIDAGLTPLTVGLGEVEVKERLDDEQKAALSASLKSVGFELLDDPRSQLVEQIRLTVLEWVRMDDTRPKMSDYLQQRLAKDYSSLSKLFSEVRGITIERFAILHRIEFAKELLCYSQLSISEIAYRLGYSSPAHLTSQFKQEPRRLCLLLSQNYTPVSFVLRGRDGCAQGRNTWALPRVMGLQALWPVPGGIGQCSTCTRRGRSGRSRGGWLRASARRWRRIRGCGRRSGCFRRGCR